MSEKSYKDSLTTPKSISRSAAADGEWIQTNIIKVDEDNIEKIAKALDDVDFNSIPSIKTSAILGVAASSYLSNYDNLNDIQNSAISGQIAYNSAYNYPWDTVVSSGNAGLSAFNQLGNYNLDNIASSADEGQQAYDKIKPYLPNELKAIETSAKNSQAGYDLIKSYKEKIENMLAVYTAISASAMKGAEASASVGPYTANWVNAHKAQNASAGFWNHVVTYSSKSADALNSAYTYLKANSGNWNTFVSALSWNSAVDTVKDHATKCWDTAATKTGDFKGFSAYSASADCWNSAYSAVCASSASWNGLSSVSVSAGFWDKMLEHSATEWNDLVSAISASAQNWTDTYNKNAKDWNTLTAATSNSAGFWDKLVSSVNASSTNWDNMVTSFNRDNGRWTNLYADAAKYAGFTKTVNDNYKNWNKLSDYNKNSATNMNNVVTWSSKSADKMNGLVDKNTGEFLYKNTWNTDATFIGKSATNFNNMGNYASTCATNLTNMAGLNADKYGTAYQKWNGMYTTVKEDAGSAKWNNTLYYFANSREKIFLRKGDRVNKLRYPTVFTGKETVENMLCFME